MIRIFYFIVTCLITVSISCNKNEFVKPITAQNIKVDIEKEAVTVNFEDYFSSKNVIALENTNESILSRIDRISLYNNKIFILDKRLNSVLVFNEKGHFLYKINTIGKGPLEYRSLIDYTIDETNHYLILHTDSPQAFFFYNLEDGRFFKKIKLNDFYSNISMQKGSIILYNKHDMKKNHLLFDYDLTNGKMGEGRLKINERHELYKYQGIGKPFLIKSKETYLSFPYSEVIYEYNNLGVQPKYYIDFGKNTLPEDIYEEKTEYKDLFEYARKNKYGFGVCEFRENKDFIIFKVKNNQLVIFSKKPKTSKLISFIKNNDMVYGQYKAHDGDDNKFVSVYTAEALKKQMSIYKEKPELWSKVPEYIKTIDSQITENDNPLLLIYTFKNSF